MNNMSINEATQSFCKFVEENNILSSRDLEVIVEKHISEDHGINELNIMNEICDRLQVFIQEKMDISLELLGKLKNTMFANSVYIVDMNFLGTLVKSGIEQVDFEKVVETIFMQEVRLIINSHENESITRDFM